MYWSIIGYYGRYNVEHHYRTYYTYAYDALAYYTFYCDQSFFKYFFFYATSYLYNVYKTEYRIKGTCVMINIWDASSSPDTEDGSIIYWGINKKVTKTYYKVGTTANPFARFYGVVDWWYDVEYSYYPTHYQSQQFWYRYTPASGMYSNVYSYTTVYAYYLTGSYLRQYTYLIRDFYLTRYNYYLSGQYTTLYNYIYTGISYENLYA